MLLYILFVICLSPFSQHSLTNEHEISIEIFGQVDKGILRIALYQDATAFPKPGQQIRQREIQVDGRKSYALKFSKLPEGTYAVAVYCDENKNQQLDKNLFGIPKEPYGFSRNPTNKWKEPVFEEVAIKIPTTSTTPIQIEVLTWGDR